MILGNTQLNSFIPMELGSLENMKNFLLKFTSTFTDDSLKVVNSKVDNLSIPDRTVHATVEVDHGDDCDLNYELMLENIPDDTIPWNINITFHHLSTDKKKPVQVSGKSEPKPGNLGDGPNFS